MLLNVTRPLPLAFARQLIARAIDKAESVGQRGTFVVADASGAPVAASRMDGTSGSSFGVVRAKAFTAGANREPSERFGMRMAMFPGVLSAYQQIMRDPVFPAGGGVPVTGPEGSTGGFSTGGGLGPLMKWPGLDPEALIVEGKPTNVEDVVISYAVGGGYSPQHGDDMKRWVDAYGAAPDGSVRGRGLDEAPTASNQRILDAASQQAQAAIDVARDRGVAVTVVVADLLGEMICLDRMDGGAPAGVDIALALAATAVNFGCATHRVAEQFEDARHLDQLLAITPYRLATFGGGVPILSGDVVEGALGIAGVAPEVAQSIAEQAAGVAALG
jgi:uncharacterized protein GlcG (DUF336 family)